MRDTPHGWSCAELLLPLQDWLFFEAAENSDPHIFLIPGVMPDWLVGSASAGVTAAPTVFGGPFTFHLTHDANAKEITLTIAHALSTNPWYIYPCCFGEVQSATSDAGAVHIVGRKVHLPTGTTTATIR